MSRGYLWFLVKINCMKYLTKYLCSYMKCSKNTESKILSGFSKKEQTIINLAILFFISSYRNDLI